MTLKTGVKILKIQLRITGINYSPPPPPSNTCFLCEHKYGGRESATRCNFRKHMQIEKAPANQENIFISLTVDGANALNTTKKETRCKCSQHNQKHCICSAFLFWLCCEHLQRVCCQFEEVLFLICRCFFYLQRVELSRPPYI